LKNKLPKAHDKLLEGIFAKEKELEKKEIDDNNNRIQVLKRKGK